MSKAWLACLSVLSIVGLVVVASFLSFSRIPFERETKKKTTRQKQTHKTIEREADGDKEHHSTTPKGRESEREIGGSEVLFRSLSLSLFVLRHTDSERWVAGWYSFDV